MSKVKVREFFFELESGGKTPAALTDRLIGWKKISIRTPFIKLHRIRCEPGSWWANPLSAATGYSMNTTINFYRNEGGYTFHAAWLSVSVPAGNAVDVALTYRRELEFVDAPFEGLITPSDFWIVLGKGGADGVNTYLKNMNWTVQVFYEDYLQPISPIALLIQRVKRRRT